jgi:NAD(P)-dependent dehydrogenase (short-subunit alcohol dehydrogenase family)
MSRVLVTGGASGLGLALVRRFAARGDRVLSCDITDITDAVETADTAHIAETTDIGDIGAGPTGPGSSEGAPGGADRASGHAAAGDAVVRRRLDVRSEEDWEAARAWVEAEWGGLDLLVNNAGVAGGGRIELTSLEDWQWIFDINLFGVVRGTRAFTPMLKAQGSGRVVNVASLAGLVHPPGMGSYNAVKAAVVAFSETVAHELAPYGVGCTAVCPSFFRTNLMDSMRGEDADLAAGMSRLVDTSPISADDIAVAALEGVDRGAELVLPDEPARAAYALKLADRSAYDSQMRRTATRMKERQP